MAKKKVNTGNIVMLVAALLGVAAIFMMFAPGITAKVVGDSIIGKAESDTTNYSGFKVMFGEKDTPFNFNIMMFLAFIFTLVGIAGVILSILLKGKIGGFLAVVGFLLAGIFFFLFRAVLPIGFEGGKDAIDALEKGLGVTGLASVKTKFSLGVGAIMAGIFSILAALASAAATFALKK